MRADARDANDDATDEFLSYVAYLFLEDLDPLNAETRAEVAEKLTKAMADRDGGLYFETENLTVTAFLERWLNDSVRGSVRASTYASYRRQVGRYVVPAVGGTKRHLQHFLE